MDTDRIASTATPRLNHHVCLTMPYHALPDPGERNAHLASSFSLQPRINNKGKMLRLWECGERGVLWNLLGSTRQHDRRR